VANPRHSVFVAYTLIPWVGVTAVGYGLGQIYAWAPDRRRALLLRAGLGITAAFVILRSINVYGDPVRWSTQKSAAFTVLSFLNTNKYPPSLLFLLMTLGPALLFLWAVDGGTPQLLRPALVLGKVPMFYYLLHFPLIHLLAVGVCYARYGQAHWMFESPTIHSIPGHPATWMGIPFAGCLFDLVFCCARALSALPLVCRPETAPSRSLAQLFLNRARHSPSRVTPPSSAWAGIFRDSVKKAKRRKLGHICVARQPSRPSGAWTAHPRVSR
jgi:hypothetical protein